MLTASRPRRWSPGQLAAPWLIVLLAQVFAPALFAQSGLRIATSGTAQPWCRMEFQVFGLPAVTNPFDPQVIRADATFTAPSGNRLTVPAYWHQVFARSLAGSSETLTRQGAPEWRVRYAPPEPGSYVLELTVSTNGQVFGSTTTNFIVTGSVPSSGAGYVRVAAKRQYLETADGQPLRLRGAAVCWPGTRGTFDYDDWFAAMQAAGENYARLWMSPWFFGIETQPGSLTGYQLDRAWQLDYVLALAEQRGIYLELCLDYHGMFAVTPDYWGGNNYWNINPYSVTNGGPCLNQNGFFTNAVAKTAYQKRLRYLVARYGYSPNLLAWQFFNELDNVYSLLNATDVANWHVTMGNWLKSNDPFGHLRTTSFTYADQHPEIWSLPQMDFACVHSYGQSSPATTLNRTAQSFLKQFGKPVLIDEYGTSWRGWDRASDPYLRGLRQGVWGGALGGSMGTAMPWWWENIHSENVYPVYESLGKVLNRTGWGIGSWTNIGFNYSASPPFTLGEPLAGGIPFTITLPLDNNWGGALSGQLAVPNAAAATDSVRTLNSFFHGTSHADLRLPFRLLACFTNNARMVLHLNSVSWGAVLSVRSDGTELYRTNLANLDGLYAVNNEYNCDLPVSLPAGQHVIEVLNAGTDWFYLDWVRLQGVLPASYRDNWQPPPQPIGLLGSHESLIYVVAPGAVFPEGATNASLPLQQGRTVTLTNWMAGRYFAEWYDPASGTKRGETAATTTNTLLTIGLPAFSADIVGLLFPQPRLSALSPNATNLFRVRLDSETGGSYDLEQSLDLAAWSSLITITNLRGVLDITPVPPPTGPQRFFRARRSH